MQLKFVEPQQHPGRNSRNRLKANGSKVQQGNALLRAEKTMSTPTLQQAEAKIAEARKSMANDALFFAAVQFEHAAIILRHIATERAEAVKPESAA